MLIPRPAAECIGPPLTLPGSAGAVSLSGRQRAGPSESNVADGGAISQLARPDLARNPPVSGRASLAGHARPAPGQPAIAEAPPGWVIVSAALTPALLVIAFLIGDALQPISYSPIRQTMSVLAGQGATDSWVMTGALFLIGGGQLATAVGLTSVRLPARILLVVTGLCSIGVAASPEPATGPGLRHLVCAALCAATTAAWPALIARRTPQRPLILNARVCAAVTAVFTVLLCWLVIETQGGSDLGLAERMTSSVQGMWPLVVAVLLRRASGNSRNSNRDPVPTGLPPVSLRRRRVPGSRTRAARDHRRRQR